MDDKPPTIIGTVTPAPNAAGWNKSDATVTFTCANVTTGIASCSDPVTVTGETAGQAVVGIAIDKAGNTATTSVTVKLDKTPPTFAITAPANGANTFVSPMSVAGTVGDALSGPASVPCNGVPAALNGGNFSCAVPLTPGSD